MLTHSAAQLEGPGELQEVIKSALAERGPCLVEVRVDQRIPPPLEDRVRSVAGAIE